MKKIKMLKLTSKDRKDDYLNMIQYNNLSELKKTENDY